MIVVSEIPNVNGNGQQSVGINMTQGDSMSLSFQIAIAGVPVNLTGTNVKMTVAMETPLILTTENGGIEITNPAQGLFFATASSDITSAFVPGTYNFDVWVDFQLSPPVETQYLTGTFTVNQSISGFP